MKEGTKRISRRDFVKLSTAGAGAAVLFAGLDAKDVLAKVPKKWDVEADFVIVGAGGAGLAAAAEAAARGAKVLLLEKTPVSGGSSLICGGGLAFAGTDMQAAEGIKDSNELLYKDMMKVGENVNVPSVVQAYVDNQLETYEYLKKLGVPFMKKIGAGGGSSVPRMHYVKPSDVIRLLGDAAKAKGAKILLDTPVKKLVIDEKTGRVRGVIGESKKKQVSYGARKAVILTSGGFSRNKPLLAKFVPPMANAASLTGLGNYGDGLKMAWACGADIQDMPYIKATYGFDLDAKSIATDMSLIMYHGAIIVNKEGKRFVNESISYKVIGDVALMQTGAMGFQIYDTAIREKAASDPLARTQGLEERGRVHIAPTLAELAQKMGVPVAVFEQTVNEYNAGVDSGKDTQFGRATLVSSIGKPLKIEKPPFYAFPSTAVLIATYGGVLINNKAQVVDIFGSVIPGLYAAGEVTGGVHGAGYLSASAFPKALIFGRLAVKSALA